MRQFPRLQPKRVLMTADCVGGVWNYCLELASALASFGIEIIMVTMGPLPSKAQRAEMSRIPNVDLFESDYKPEWMDDPWVSVDAAGYWLLDVARRFQPDVIHLNGFCHAVLAWQRPVAVVAHSCVRSWWTAVRTGPIPAQFDEYTRRVSAGLRAASVVIAPTAAMLDDIDKHYRLEVPRAVIPNSRVAQQYFPATKQEFILTAGRLWDEAKGISLLDEIAPALKWPTCAAGEYRHPSGHQRSIRNLKILGQLSNRHLAEYLGKAAIYAAPALYEPFGLSVLEAALSGCALVLSDIPNFRENWTGAALIIERNNCDLWLKSLQNLIENPDLRLALGERARERAAAFSPEKMGRAYFSEYCKVLSMRKSTARDSSS
jgi:glycogen synthase